VFAPSRQLRQLVQAGSQPIQASPEVGVSSGLIAKASQVPSSLPAVTAIDAAPTSSEEDYSSEEENMS
jgi:hypothetical protein